MCLLARLTLAKAPFRGCAMVASSKDKDRQRDPGLEARRLLQEFEESRNAIIDSQTEEEVT